MDGRFLDCVLIFLFRLMFFVNVIFPLFLERAITPFSLLPFTFFQVNVLLTPFSLLNLTLNLFRNLPPPDLSLFISLRWDAKNLFTLGISVKGRWLRSCFFFTISLSFPLRGSILKISCFSLIRMTNVLSFPRYPTPLAIRILAFTHASHLAILIGRQRLEV